MKQQNVSANELYTKQNTQDANIKIHLETKEDQRSTMTHSNTVYDAKQKLPEPLSVTIIMVTTRAKRVLHIDPDHNLASKRCLPTRGIIKALPNRLFFILVTNTTTNQQQFEKHKELGHLNGNIFTIASAEAPQKSIQEDQSILGVVETIGTEEKPLPAAS